MYEYSFYLWQNSDRQEISLTERLRLVKDRVFCKVSCETAVSETAISEQYPIFVPFWGKKCDFLQVFR